MAITVLVVVCGCVGYFAGQDLGCPDCPDAVVDTVYDDQALLMNDDGLILSIPGWCADSIAVLNERIEWWANLLCMSGKILPPKADPCSGMVSVAAVDSLISYQIQQLGSSAHICYDSAGTTINRFEDYDWPPDTQAAYFNWRGFDSLQARGK